MTPQKVKIIMFRIWAPKIQILTHLHKRRRKHRRAVVTVVVAVAATVAMAAVVVAVVVVAAVLTAVAALWGWGEGAARTSLAGLEVPAFKHLMVYWDRGKSVLFSARQIQLLFLSSGNQLH